MNLYPDMKPGESFDEFLDRYDYRLEIHPPCSIKFTPKLPPIGMDRWFKINEAMLLFFNTLPGANERRLRDMCDVPFEL